MCRTESALQMLDPKSLCCIVLQSFAIFGGVYAFASCIAQRLRQKQDGGSFVALLSKECNVNYF